MGDEDCGLTNVEECSRLVTLFKEKQAQCLKTLKEDCKFTERFPFSVEQLDGIGETIKSYAEEKATTYMKGCTNVEACSNNIEQGLQDRLLEAKKTVAKKLSNAK